MSRASARVLVFGLVLAVSLVLVYQTGPAGAQACAQKAMAERDTPLYSQLPQFVTGRGLVYGPQAGVLKKGTPVYICSQATVGLWPYTQLWYRIAYWNRMWSYNWVSARDIRVGVGTNVAPYAAGLPVVSAAPAPESPAASPVLSLRAAAPAPQPAGLPPDPPADSTAVDEAALLPFYGWSFLVLVVGMIAKTLVDVFGSTEPVQVGRIIRSMIVPLLVSPIVFLGFMQTQTLTIRSIGGFIVLLCFAFQSGFFWQTVMTAKRAQ